MIEVMCDYKRVTIRGHAGYGENGNDIVCAAVTILWHTITEKMAKEDVAFGMYEESGYAEMTVTETKSEKRYIEEILMDTFIVGMESIEENYPENLSLKKF